jgi:hypothetical protein
MRDIVTSTEVSELALEKQMDVRKEK